MESAELEGAALEVTPDAVATAVKRPLITSSVSWTSRNIAPVTRFTSSATTDAVLVAASSFDSFHDEEVFLQKKLEDRSRGLR